MTEMNSFEKFSNEYDQLSIDNRDIQNNNDVLL
jgi:hypothetical protein